MRPLASLLRYIKLERGVYDCKVFSLFVCFVFSECGHYMHNILKFHFLNPNIRFGARTFDSLLRGLPAGLQLFHFLAFALYLLVHSISPSLVDRTRESHAPLLPPFCCNGHELEGRGFLPRGAQVPLRCTLRGIPSCTYLENQEDVRSHRRPCFPR